MREDTVLFAGAHIDRAVVIESSCQSPVLSAGEHDPDLADSAELNGAYVLFQTHKLSDGPVYAVTNPLPAGPVPEGPDRSL